MSIPKRFVDNLSYLWYCLTMKMRFDLNPPCVKGWPSYSSIILFFCDGSLEAFYDWLDKNRERLFLICEKRGWACDVSFSEKAIYLSKFPNKKN